MIDTLQIEIRPMGEDDKAFVASSWKKSFRSSSTVSWVGNSNYYDEMNKRVEKLLEKHNVDVAYNPKVSSQLYGWACYEKDPAIIHYTYVKQVFRMGQAATRLWRPVCATKKEILFTHWTDVCRQLVDKYPNLKYAPEALK